MSLKGKEVDLEKVKEKAHKAREIAGEVFKELRQMAREFRDEQKKVNSAFMKNLAELYETTLGNLEAELKPGKGKKKSAAAKPKKRTKKAAKK